MKVSFNQTASPNVKDTNGFGYAAKMCKDSLVELGHEVSWRDSTADVEINFIQPDHWIWTGPYRIGYLPWESTKLREHWIAPMNEVDEVWTPSPVIAEWFADEGVTTPIKVYEHGVEPLWSPVKRDNKERFRMLHHGAEALRKGGNDTIQAFLQTFSDDDPATLVLKMQLDQFNLHDTERIQIRRQKMPIDELVALYQSCHLFVYPSWGEGFGLTPLQAMATGMPVLVTEGWAPYERFLGSKNLIRSSLVESPWQIHHPGKMFQPDRDDLMDKMRWHFENREDEARVAEDLAVLVAQEYDWIELTRKAFAHLV